MESVATIFSITMDMYLTYQMISFLDGRLEQKVTKKNLFCGIWMLITAICLRFLVDGHLYGFFYFGSIALLLICERKNQVVKRLLYMFGSALVIGLTNLVITCGLSFVFYEELYFFNVPVLELAAGLICFLIYYLLMRAGRKYMAGMETRFSNSLLTFSLLMLGANSYILMYALNFAKGIKVAAEKREISMVFSMVSVGMLVELVLVMLSVAGVYAYRKMISYKDALIEAQATHTEVVKQKNYELRAVKHDCKSHYVVLEYLLKKERYKEAENYAKSLTYSLQGIGECYNTGSFIVDALVNEKAVLARKNGIDFSFSGRLPEQWSVVETDQCILFSNILNNAFEAVMKVEERARKVEISIRLYEAEMLVRVANTYNGKLNYRDGEFITSKANKDEHGFGLKNIKEIAQKYGGNVDVKREDEMFVLLVRV